MVAILATFYLIATPKLNLSTSAYAAQYGYIRAAQEAKEETSASQHLNSLQKGFPPQFTTRSGRTVTEPQAQVTELYWRTIDALAFSAGDASRLVSIPAVMPKIGGALDSNEVVNALTKALEESKANFNTEVWPAGERAVKKQIDAFQAIPEAKRNLAVEFILKAAGIAKAPVGVDILVIPKMPGREGMTVRTPAGTRIVISIGKYEGVDFAEVVLHEATHVFDTTAGEESLFAKLRKALTEAKRPGFEVEQVPHVCMFLLAAEATRKFIDPSHKDVGETFGAYERGLGPLRDKVQPELQKMIDGQSADQTVTNIVAKLKE